MPLTNLHSDEILDESQLPISYVANTPCFRAEAGSGGRDTRGLFRQHQFHKVELVKICTPEQSDKAHHELVADVEAVMQLLELPYRKVRFCNAPSDAPSDAPCNAPCNPPCDSQSPALLGRHRFLAY